MRPDGPPGWPDGSATSSRCPSTRSRSVWARYRNLRDFDGDWLAARDALARTGIDRSLRDGVLARRSRRTTSPGSATGFGSSRSPGRRQRRCRVGRKALRAPVGRQLGEQFDAFMTSFPAGRGAASRGHARRGRPARARRRSRTASRSVLDDGWAAVGDAAGFIDPFYSPGLDWAALTDHQIRGAHRPRAARRAGGSADPRVIARHNREFTVGFSRWFEALYRDKYYSMGDAELMEVALRTRGLPLLFRHLDRTVPAGRGRARRPVLPSAVDSLLPA